MIGDIRAVYRHGRWTCRYIFLVYILERMTKVGKKKDKEGTCIDEFIQMPSIFQIHIAF